MKKTSKVLEAHFAAQIERIKEFCNSRLDGRGYPKDGRVVEIDVSSAGDPEYPLRCNLSVKITHNSGGVERFEKNWRELPSDLMHIGSGLDYADLVRNKAALAAYQEEQRAEVLESLAADYDAGRLYRRGSDGRMESVK